MRKSYCRHPMCPNITTEGAYCPSHTPKKTYNLTKDPAYDWAWYAFSKKFIAKYPKCAVCDEASKFTGHYLMSAKEMVKQFGKFILEEKYYRPLCPVCSALDRSRNGR